jgi:hypothetical protein
VATAVLWISLAAGIAQGSILIAIVGPLVVTVAHLAQSLVYVALRTEAFRGELDREWLARLNAEKVVPALLWAIFATVCLVLPHQVFDNWQAVVALATGPVSAVLGKYSPVVRPQQGAAGARIALSFRVLADLTAGIFAVALFTVLARVGQQLTNGSVAGAAVLIVLAGGLSLWFGWRINVNRFSLHAVYRNRLVRAFLGSARPERTPDLFTGFDPRDNPRMVDLGEVAAPRKLFPVINTTLNVTEGERNAWSARAKASPSRPRPAARLTCCGGKTTTPATRRAALMCRRPSTPAARRRPVRRTSRAAFPSGPRSLSPAPRPARTWAITPRRRRRS